MKKLVVFPNDPISAYYKKGEIKERYYNPCNTFDEVKIISFTPKDIEESKVQTLIGNAKLKIHSVGTINFFNKSKKKDEILKLVREFNPDVIRSYNPLLQGWIAAHCSEELNIPFFVSLHVQYDGLRRLLKKQNYKKYLALKYSRKKIEPYTLSKADKITAVYKIIEPYVIELSGKHPEILYNRIDLQRFKNGKKISDYDKPLVLSVGRLSPQKNHDCLIKAVKDLNVYLLIIGSGEQQKKLKALVTDLNLKNKIIFKNSVLNEKIQDYYKSADLFALAYDPEVEGVPIPVLEAMAAGLPVVISKPKPELSDGLEGVVAFSELNPESFSSEIEKILKDTAYAETLRKNAQVKSVDFDGKNTEKREAEIYKQLLSSKKLS